MMPTQSLFCRTCHTSFAMDRAIWQCPCGGYLELSGTYTPTLSTLQKRGVSSFWRFTEALPAVPPISIGESLTPLTPVMYGGQLIHFKLDYLLPTGSYKDRGVAVMISQLSKWGLDRIVEDSSGNAGSSVAAYGTKANIVCDIYIPENTSTGKAAQIAFYGANLIKIPGNREETADAALHAGQHSFYASHNWSPFFEHGVKTYVYEIWEQLGYELPDIIIAPCGNGSLITSAYLAIVELHEARLATRIPKIVAVQAQGCAPLARGWTQGLDHAVPIEKKETLAEGISSAKPIKDMAIIKAVRQTKGCFVTVTDAEIWASMQQMAKLGMFIEPTSATATAALSHLQRQAWIKPDDKVVVELTGNGLKAVDKLTKLMQHT